jgi:DNA-binding response OmpR family regulator
VIGGKGGYVAEAGGPGRPKGTILLVDDERSILDLMALILREAGFEPLLSISGYEAFATLDKRLSSLGEPRVSLIISDWMMPGWDGIKLLSSVRASPFKAIPFILMSGQVTREQLEIAGRNRADSILLKPVHRETLIAKVNEVLRKRAPAAAA